MKVFFMVSNNIFMPKWNLENSELSFIILDRRL
jgi:hypothetical protein